MREQGYDSATRFSLDEAVTDFMTWLESRQEERKIGKVEGKQPGKNETWVPKYDTITDIFAEYGHDAADGAISDKLDVDEAEIADVLARLRSDSEPEF